MDILSWQRSSIAEHEQNQHALHECLSLLIDVLRDVLLHWFEVNPARARAQIEAWWSSKLPLLHRLAVYGVSVDPKLSGDERLEWLLNNELIFRLGMKKEVFDVLSAAYPSSSEPTRKRLVKRIEQGFKGALKKRLGPETGAYEQFNVLIWLRKADVKCPLVADAIAKMKKTHPNFGEREHPAFDHWSGGVGFIDPKEGFNIDEILSDEHTLHNLGHYLAGLAMRIVKNPVESGFFRDFLPRLPDNVRGSMARGMGDFLEASPEKAVEVWNLWLREYLDSRLVGVPVALSDQETKAIADWCLYLGDAFPEAVQRIVQMRLKGVFAYGIVDKLLKSPLLDTFPRESCRYVNAITRGEDHAFLHEHHSKLHTKFKQVISGTPEFKEFEELLYLRGWKR